MKRFIPFFLIIFLTAGVFAQVGTLTVTVLSSEAGTGLTEIEYEFTGDEDVYNISAEVSFDNGNSFDPIPGAHLEGTLTNVAPGGPYFLTWDGMASFPETFSNETIIKINATATTLTCGDDLTFTYNGQEVTYGTVLVDYDSNDPPHNIGTRCWLDRNLGANPMPFVPAEDATNQRDRRLYGDLFQWGRGDDGHQDRTSTTTSTLSTTDDPGHGNFITVGSSPFDWRDGQNNNLWQGGENDNNPCPPGWRVPTQAELNAEIANWSAPTYYGAYASTLKWSVGGRRTRDGGFNVVNRFGYVWSSSVSGANARYLNLGRSSAYMGIGNRAGGMSVRCVRDN